jgi:hypothetical protein
VTPRALRHTYLVYLLRKGIRFADISRIVGRLPPEQLAICAAPSQPRLPLDRSTGHRLCGAHPRRGGGVRSTDGAAAAPLAAGAQQPMPVIGFLSSRSQQFDDALGVLVLCGKA